MTPIHVIARRLERIPLHHRIAHLKALAAAEKPRSGRRNELEGLLAECVLKQLKRETRAA
ncbi:hypothetical protein AYJ54_00620 [Bradyrhizobium centrolobii]|uniref:Uncharacterized protein n=1 Tax=Bradyrhizobium centrolobii TaxID=1505087 RepID=A0A176YFM7_9BRAD|nr:hypothetical protein [Bradyrhizobium centrolobii]OAF05442.1 hypothetical protein AYJ54_00620 [Bradyrhizobium centrolobii]